MRKPLFQARKFWLVLATGVGVIGIVAGALIPIEKLQQVSQVPSNVVNSLQSVTAPESGGVGTPSRLISPLVAKSATERAGALKQATQSASSTLERDRARYLLATDLIAQGQGEKALEQLKDLEKSYPVLAAQIGMKRAQAYEVTGKQKEAAQTLQAIVKQFPKEPATAEALFTLGRKNSQYWDQALAQFPSHPRSIEIAKTRLKQNPKQLPLLLIVAKYGTSSNGYTELLDKLVSQYGTQLQPQDWEAIAFGYWENQVYDKGAIAYARAPQTPLTAYRSARGLHLSGRPGAIERYRQMVQQFPNSPEAGLALTRLAALADTPPTAIAYLDQVIQNFPDRAPEALVEKSKLLDKMNSAKTAAQMRQLVLTQYANSEAAAEMRWDYAQRSAKTGNLKLAKQWAEPVLTHNPTSEIAAEAGFWAGKWAQRIGNNDQAAKLFQKVLSEHSESYYAWRSAAMLGWNVGDFNTVRSMNPQVQKPLARPELPAGSPALKELYQLGQERDAWSHWQIEFQNRVQPSIAEQFTDGVMRLGVGENLDGLYMVGSLRDREKPEDKAKYQELRKQIGYWQALYPFPYVDTIENWSQQRQLNPMLVTALIRQESRFEPDIKSSVGAVGLMQVMPETGEYIANNIKVKQFKLADPETNIKFGTWYLDYTHLQYDNNSMLAVASYNAGPGAVAGWVSKAKSQDPDEFVEAIPYSETRGYVKSVLGNYWNYLRLYNPEISQRVAQVAKDHPKGN
ncbi:transglycosylase SLT domain-containing protein [Leptolyngbya sp. FACHB-17]|uniref:lytic transglycosylase domain-containing protein n=1 Tax=unclassified Leptolyngbya TaxID=2650499 RepID=UPI00168175C9|nr:transglycosylase SLT domain-containing protein [Leptolyngbya sp. FACHB-17]MBD2078698.1 transglycosylase SLT domain-containing protein [Leptolyngbya sp. FACHB-17]